MPGVLPVGEKDRLVGMITDRDIAVRAVAMGLGPDTPVRKVMSHEVLYCDEDDELEAVAHNMSDIKGPAASGHQQEQAACRHHFARRHRARRRPELRGTSDLRHFRAGREAFPVRRAERAGLNGHVLKADPENIVR